MTDTEVKDRVFAHAVGAMLGMSIVVWSLAWPLLVASRPWWIER